MIGRCTATHTHMHDQTTYTFCCRIHADFVGFGCVCARLLQVPTRTNSTEAIAISTLSLARAFSLSMPPAAVCMHVSIISNLLSAFKSPQILNISHSIASRESVSSAHRTHIRKQNAKHYTSFTMIFSTRIPKSRYMAQIKITDSGKTVYIVCGNCSSESDIRTDDRREKEREIPCKKKSMNIKCSCSRLNWLIV